MKYEVMLEPCCAFERGRVNFQLSTLITKTMLSKAEVASGAAGTSYSVSLLFC